MNRSNTIEFPSGDQSGTAELSISSIPVSCVISRVAISTTNICVRRSLIPVKTSCRPSGDQEGSPSPSLLCVRRCGSVPSAFIMKISADGSVASRFRYRVKAICVPSGDQRGSLSLMFGGCCVSRLRREPSSFITNRSRSTLKTILPSVGNEVSPKRNRQTAQSMFRVRVFGILIFSDPFSVSASGEAGTAPPPALL